MSFDALPDAVVRLDADRRIVEHIREQMIGMPVPHVYRDPRWFQDRGKMMELPIADIDTGFKIAAAFREKGAQKPAALLGVEFPMFR